MTRSESEPVPENAFCRLVICFYLAKLLQIHPALPDLTPGIVLAAEGLASAKPGFVDRLIQGAYVASGSTMATFEKASGKLKSVRVL